MIIVCSGPDTYRAREKARELVAAFRSKHDPHGLATEILDGPVELSTLLSRLSSGSLFATKKLIRADGCLEKMKIADVRTLAARLAADGDHTIILTLEEEPPNAKTLEALASAPLFHYPFEMQTGALFRAWVRKEAVLHGVSQDVADRVAAYADGDTWLAVHELEKQAVHPQRSYEAVQGSETIFTVADAILTQRSAWRSLVSLHGDDAATSVALGQSRSFLEVRDGYAESVHPYVAKKLSAARIPSAEERVARLLKGFVASRNGLASGAETETLL
jgi:hypothetical protein